jgi:hypothetical protein
VEQAVDAGLDLDERAVVGEVADLALDDRAGGYFSETSSQGLTSVCFMPRLISCLFLSMSRTTTSTSSPDADHLGGWLTRRVQDISEMWTRPSMPSSSLTNAP